VVAGADRRRDLLGGEAEEEEVLRPHRVTELDVGPVQRPHGERAVERELHVPRAGRLLARGGDLLRDVRGRDDPLGEAHPVVGEEHHLDAGAPESAFTTSAMPLISRMMSLAST
jgi:hypothetical protein